MTDIYKNNFLKEVILRIDFLNPINEFDNEIPHLIAAEILKHFPIAEPNEIIGEGFQIIGNKLEKATIKNKEWIFYGKHKEKMINLSKGSLIMNFNEYISFEDYLNHYIPILDKLFEYNRDIQISRLGLRYIDNIEFPNKDVLNWKGYLNKNMISIFDVPEEKDKLSRAFSAIELNYDIFNIRLQYGMHNPDFPAIIKKKIFIIDTDAYCQGLLAKEDMIELLPKMHDKVKKIFERSITQKMREKMNE